MPLKKGDQVTEYFLILQETGPSKHGHREMEMIVVGIPLTVISDAKQSSL